MFIISVERADVTEGTFAVISIALIFLWCVATEIDANGGNLPIFLILLLSDKCTLSLVTEEISYAIPEANSLPTKSNLIHFCSAFCYSFHFVVNANTLSLILP